MDCPRCDRDQAYKFFESPKKGAWELYRCPLCQFVWRSTEKASIRDKDLFTPSFKLTEDKISQMMEKPTIPPLKEGR